MTTRIEDYALIGDCETAARVGRDGSIDWLCTEIVVRFGYGGLLSEEYDPALVHAGQFSARVLDDMSRML